MARIHVYCKKCGSVRWLQRDTLEEDRCYVCDSLMSFLPKEYIGEKNLFTEEEEERIRNDLVKTSSEFDPYIFEHRDEIRAQRRDAFRRMMDEKEAYVRKMNNRRLRISDDSCQPKCPTCSSMNIERISGVSKVMNAGLFGILGNKRKMQFKCKNCGYMW